GGAVRQEGQGAILVGNGEWRVVVRCEDETGPAFGLVKPLVLALDPAHLARGVDQLFDALIRFLLDRVAMILIARSLVDQGEDRGRHPLVVGSWAVTPDDVGEFRPGDVLAAE